MTSSKYIISQQRAIGSEIREIAEELEPLLRNKKRASAVIALLSMAILLQEPELSIDQLQDIISDVSRRIAFLIENLNSDDTTVN